MKLIKSKLLQANDGRKRGKYQVVLEVTDYDIDMLEVLATCVVCMEGKPGHDLQSKYYRWLRQTFPQFQKLWRRYDRR